jgi:hypothetical protein
MARNTRPLLEKWPEQYRGGGFRLDGEDVLIFARGQPTLRLSAARRPAAGMPTAGATVNLLSSRGDFLPLTVERERLGRTV